MATQKEKAERFKALHEREGTFIIPNPWDSGSARLLAGLGFEALATTSAGFANSLGRLDGQVTPDEVRRRIVSSRSCLPRSRFSARAVRAKGKARECAASAAA